MDRNNIIGFALIFVVLMAWSYFNAKQTQRELAEQKIQDSIAFVKHRDDSLRKAISAPDTNKTSIDLKKILPANSLNIDTAATASEYIIENDLLKVTLNSFGGKIAKAELKKYKEIREVPKGDDIKVPVVLLKNDQNDWYITTGTNGNSINTKDIIFSAVQKDKSSIEFFAKTTDGKQINQSYTLRENSYNLDYSIQIPGQSGNKPKLTWTNVLESQEKNADYEKTFTTTHYKYLDEDPSHIGWGKEDEEKLEKSAKWISTAQQFFNTTIVADQSFENVTLKSSPFGEKSRQLSTMQATADLNLNNETAKLKWYIGPNEFATLKSQGDQMQDIISFGASILGTINKYVIRPVFSFLSKFVGNKGIVILLLTLIVKLCLFPLSYKMLHSQAKMSALKPEMAHLKEKFKDDPQQQQMESMKIYREFGVNPLGGCMPMLLQMPIWLALYQFFPASIEFRQSSFLWANDLSSYDVFAKLPFTLPFYGGHVSMFTLIWVVSTLVFTYYSTKDQDFSMNPAMKYMQYLMPLFFLFFFNNSAAGLTAYMSFSNILNIAQTLGGKALFFPEAKMKAELSATKAKPKKKGGFQERLETMMKEQQNKVETSKQKQIKK